MSKVDDEIRQKVMELPRPYPSNAKYLIEAELDDIVNLIVALINKAETKARIDELEKQLSWIKDFNDDVAYNIEKRLAELRKQL